MSNPLIYEERISSNRTELLFVLLTLLLFMLLVWRVCARRFELVAAIFLTLFGVFFFYAVNYRTLLIQLSADSLRLKFGIFSWTVPLDNVAAIDLDDAIPTFKRLGGAGIHFMRVHNRYRASFNFLEHPRVVIALKRKTGPVQDISFSTRHPDTVVQHIREALRPSYPQQDVA